MWREEWNVPLGTLVFLAQLGPEQHTHTCTHTQTRTHTPTAGGMLLQVGALLLRAGWKETLKLQRGNDRWPVWQLHTLAHAHTHAHTHLHAQTPSDPPPLGTPVKVPNDGLYLVQPFSFLPPPHHPSYSISPALMNLSYFCCFRQLLCASVPFKASSLAHI